MLYGLAVDRLRGHEKAPACLRQHPEHDRKVSSDMTSVPNTTTQRDELAREIRVADVVAARDTSSNEYEAMADAVLAKYIPVPRPTVGEARRGNFQVILIDGVAISDDADWLRSELATEEQAMESRAYRAEHIRTTLAYLDTEAAAQAETKLQERRDALSLELVPDGDLGMRVPYKSRTASLRKAIDRIIELEDGAEAAK